MGAKRLNAKLTDFNSPSGALLHFKIIKILVGNRKPLDFSISVRSASNVASVRIYNVMRNIKVHLTPKIFFAKIIRLILWRKNFLIWLNPRISTPRQNRVSDGSRPSMTTSRRFKCVPQILGSLSFHIFTLLFLLITYS